MKKFTKSYGKRVPKYTAKSILTEYKIFQKDFNKNIIEENLFKTILTGFCYLKEKNIFPFEKLSNFLRKDFSSVVNEDLHHQRFENLIDAGKECFNKYGLDYLDVNKFYLFNELQEDYYKTEFLNKIKEEYWQEYFFNKDYYTENFKEGIAVGLIKKKYISSDIFSLYKIQLNEIKKMKEDQKEFYTEFLTGYSFMKEEQEKLSFPFEKLSKELKRTPIVFDTSNYYHLKVPEKLIVKGKECLKTFGLTFDDINNFYYYEILKENSFKLFVKKEMKDEDPAWKRIFILKKIKQF